MQISNGQTEYGHHLGSLQPTAWAYNENPISLSSSLTNYVERNLSSTQLAKKFAS